VGIYGVMSYAVTQRTRELGIRIALGASSTDIRRLILGKALALGGAGIGLGALLSLGTNRLLASQLFATPLIDPLPLAIVAIALLSAATLASWLPARRAMRITPVEALRAE
jgi:ABC-type antimicrobial peptide transport system permease subunit